MTMTLLGGAGTLATVATSFAQPLRASPATSTTAAQWLKALTPVSQRLPGIEDRLRALPPTATSNEVEVIVAPVAALIAPVAKLAGAPSPISLESLGQPSEGVGISHVNPMCYGYKSHAQGARLGMAGTAYHQGFQLSTLYVCRGTWTWAWHIAGQYRAFGALVGLGSGDTGPATLRFLSPSGSPSPFIADGHTVKSVTLIAGLPTHITVPFVGVENFVVSTTTPGANINFANDVLRP